jgi:hypothetical protein
MKNSHIREELALVDTSFDHWGLEVRGGVVMGVRDQP